MLPKDPINLKFVCASQKSNEFEFCMCFQRSVKFKVWTCFQKVQWIWILDLCFLKIRWIWSLDVLLRGPIDLNFGCASQRSNYILEIRWIWILYVLLRDRHLKNLSALKKGVRHWHLPLLGFKGVATYFISKIRKFYNLIYLEYYAFSLIGNNLHLGRKNFTLLWFLGTI